MSYVTSNRAHWDVLADDYARQARQMWAQPEPTWGTFDVPQAQVPMLPADVADLDVLELGCGTGYVSAWAARAGARPVGLDNSARQLATARQLQREFDLSFPLIQADGEQVPLADASFDLVISEYGASIWCDPYRWIPQAARLLRPGGRLVFLPGVEFHLGHGDWIRLLRGSGFEIEDMIEVYAPESAPRVASFVSLEWATQWPSEEVWFARLR